VSDLSSEKKVAKMQSVKLWEAIHLGASGRVEDKGAKATKEKQRGAEKMVEESFPKDDQDQGAQHVIA
jgi:hypothetical protein